MFTSQKLFTYAKKDPKNLGCVACRTNAIKYTIKVSNSSW